MDHCDECGFTYTTIAAEDLPRRLQAVGPASSPPSPSFRTRVAVPRRRSGRHWNTPATSGTSRAYKASAWLSHGEPTSPEFARLRCSDPKPVRQGHRPGYKHLLEVERGWRDMSTTLDLRPEFHRREDRIRAHILLGRLTLLLVRVRKSGTSPPQGGSASHPGGITASHRRASICP